MRIVASDAPSASGSSKRGNTLKKGAKVTVDVIGWNYLDQDVELQTAGDRCLRSSPEIASLHSGRIGTKHAFSVE